MAAAEAWRKGAAFAADTRDALRESPGIRVLLFTTILSSFVGGLLIPVLPLFLIERGFSLLQLGGLFSLVAVGSIAVQVLAGRYQVALSRRPVVLGLLLVGVFTFPAYLFVQTPLQFLGVAAVSSLASAASVPGIQLLLAEAAPVRRRAALFAYFGLVASLSYAAAVVVGYAVSARSYEAVLYLGTLAALLSFLVMAGLAASEWLAARAALRSPALSREERDALAAARATRGALRGAQVELFRARRRLESLLPRPRQAAWNVRWLTLHLFLFGTSLAIYPVYFPLHLLQLGLPHAWGGVVIAASWVTFGLCQPLGARFADRTGKHRALIVGSLVAAAALNLVLAFGSLPFVIVAWVLLGIADGLGRPVTTALVAASATRAGRASAFGWTSAGVTAARVVSPYALALVIAGGGISRGLALVGALVLLAALPLLAVRSLDAPVAQAAPVAQPGGAA